MQSHTALSFAMTKDVPFAEKTASRHLTLILAIATIFATYAVQKGKSYIALKHPATGSVKAADLSAKIYLIILKTPARENAPSADL